MKQRNFKAAKLTETGSQFYGAGQLGDMVDQGGENKGWKWSVVVFKFGKSSTPPHFVYTKEAAQKSIDVIATARVYSNSESDAFGHKKDSSKKVTRDIVGVLTDPVITETGLHATLNILPSGAWLRENLMHVFSNKLPLPYELSIDAYGKATQGNFNGETLPIAEQFDRLDLDVVERGAAGGKFLRMAASQTHNSQGVVAMKDKLMLLFALCHPMFLESKNIDWLKVNENELFTHLLEAEKATPRLHLPDGSQLTETLLDTKLNELREKVAASKDQFMEAWKAKLDKLFPPDDANKGKENELDKNKKADDYSRMLEGVNLEIEQLKRSACATLLNAKLVESKLPKSLLDDVRAQFTESAGGTKIFDEKTLDASIKRTRDTYASFTASLPNNRGLDVNIGQTDGDKAVLGIDGFFLEGSRIAPLSADERKTLLKGVPAFKSFREAYIAITGDEDVSGLKRNTNRMTASLATTDFGEVVANALNKRLVRDYGMMGLDAWRQICDVVALKDFKQQNRIRYGGYANLPARAEGAAYVALSSPTDEQATYTPATKGGTEDITRELIMNDDVGAIQKIPARMARAAAQTLHEFVFDFIRPGVNPTIYDSVALYHANHANTGTTALASAALAAARLRMKKQTMKDNSKRLGLRAGFLFVPSDLEEAAYALVTAASGLNNTVPTFVQSQKLQSVVIDYWTDATDWAIASLAADLVGLEIGFINGQETPELFVSDVANVGSWFTNDKITYKIRHEYGGAVTDYRAFDGSIVV